MRQIAGDPNAKFIAGGTNLIDLMKMDVERPTKVIDITRLPLKQVENTPGGGLRIGALVRNSDLAYHPLVEERYPVLASAIMAGASQQLRNMASTGGNLLAAHALPLLLRHRHALQQTRAGQRLLRHRRPKSHARDPRRQRRLHRDASIRHVRGARAVGGEGSC